MRSDLTAIVSGACACGFLLTAQTAVAEEWELWFVSDILAADYRTMECSENQEQAKKAADIVKNRMRSDAMLLTTEVNNCRDYDGAYDRFDLGAYGFEDDSWWSPVPGNHDYYYKDSDGKWTSNGLATAFHTRLGMEASSYTWGGFALGPWFIFGLDSELNDNTYYTMDYQASALQSELVYRYVWGSPCQVGFFHRPAFSNATKHPNDRLDEGITNILTTSRVELVLSGHEHVYERLAPIDGMVQIVAGTGGAGVDSGRAFEDNYPRGQTSSGYQDRLNNKYGVVRLVVRSDGTYLVEFYRVSSQSSNGVLTDTYSGVCTG